MALTILLFENNNKTYKRLFQPFVFLLNIYFQRIANRIFIHLMKYYIFQLCENGLEAIATFGFLVEISRRRSAGRECELVNQAILSVDGTLQGRINLRHTYSSMSGTCDKGSPPISDEKTFLRWLLVRSNAFHADRECFSTVHLMFLLANIVS